MIKEYPNETDIIEKLTDMLCQKFEDSIAGCSLDDLLAIMGGAMHTNLVFTGREKSEINDLVEDFRGKE